MVEPAGALVVPEMVTEVLSEAERLPSPTGSLMFNTLKAGTGFEADMGDDVAPRVLKVDVPS